MRRKVSAKEKGFAAARVIAGRSTAAEEAEKLHVSPQIVRAWVREQRAQPPEENPTSVPPSLQGSGPATAPGSSNPGAPGAEPVPEASPLDRARAAAGIHGQPGAGSAAPPPLPTAEQLRAADQADKDLVIETAVALKAGGLKMLAARAGLPEDDPDLEKISGLTPIAATALQANAGWIAPIIREKVQGKIALVIALGIEAVLTFAAFKSILEARGLLKKKKKGEEDGEEPKDPKKPEAPGA